MMICSGSAYNMFKHWLSKFRGCSLLTTPITNHPRGVMADCIRCCYSDLRVSSAAHKLSQTLQTAAECEWGNLLVFYLFTLLQLTKDGYGRVAVDREVKIEGKKRSIPAGTWARCWMTKFWLRVLEHVSTREENVSSVNVFTGLTRLLSC